MKITDVIAVKIDKARALLAEARNAQDAKQVVDLAHAAEVYAKRQKLSDEAIAYAHEIKIEAQKLLGDFLKSSEKAKGSRGQLKGDVPSGTKLVGGNKTEPPTGNDIPSLEEMGITKKESSESQFLSTLAAEAPEIFDSVKTGEKSVTQARQELARQHIPEPAVTPELPDGKYQCIVIDPPWPVKKIEREERPNQGVELDYPTMTLEQIAELPVSDLADEDGCHLYLWVTQKYLPAGLELIKQWGFDYQCLMTWVKPTGMTPYSWMYNTEHVIFAHCGSLKLERMGLKLSFEAPVTGHSKKPDVFYDRVIAASPENRLEMFARERREGFDVWGNEVSQQ